LLSLILVPYAGRRRACNDMCTRVWLFDPCAGPPARKDRNCTSRGRVRRHVSAHNDKFQEHSAPASSCSSGCVIRLPPREREEAAQQHNNAPCAMRHAPYIHYQQSIITIIDITNLHSCMHDKCGEVYHASAFCFKHCISYRKAPCFCSRCLFACSAVR
jgi:hypothetical protein